MKRAAVLAVIVIGLAGCGEPGISADATTSPASSTEASSSAPTSATASPVSSTTVSEARPVAPDFVLGLGDGGTFVLSEEARPVYLVFWAEW